MSDVLRSTTFQLEFQGQDGITGIKQFTRAVTDADKVVEELSSTMGENVQVTYSNVRSKQELTAEARALVGQIERTNSKVKELTSLYQHQIGLIGKTAQEQEVLNAMYKLGSSATQQQKQQLTDLIGVYQQLSELENIASKVRESVSAYEEKASALKRTNNEQEIYIALSKLGANATQLEIEAVRNAVIAYQNLAEANKSQQEAKRTEQAVESLIAEYARLNNMIGRTAAEQAALNAVYRLGSNATEEQKKKVAEVAYNYGLAAQKAQETSESFRGLRGISQQLGWQLQDVAVQAQLGTSAFVIFSQQGSQLAAAFGPTGALVGAVIAVAGAIGGALVNSMGVAGEEIDKLIQKVDKLGKATKELAAIELRKKIQDDQKRLVELDTLTRLGFLQDKQRSGVELSERELKQLLELTSQREQLTDSITTQEGYLDTLTRSETENIEKSKKAIEAQKDLLKQYGLKIKFLSQSDREQAKVTASIQLGEGATKDMTDAVMASINAYYDEKAAIKTKEKAQKEAEKASKKAATEAQRIVKARERAFQAETLSLIKQTETTEQEYNRRKAIIDEYVKYEGRDQRTDQAYAALEQWRTDQLTKETDKQIREFERREKARRQIEKGQKKLIPGVDDETSRYEANIRILTQQNSQIEAETQRHITSLRQARDNGKMSETQYNLEVQQAQANELSEQQRINALKESEEERHTRAMEDLQTALYQAQLQSVASAAMVMSSTVDLMSTGIEDVKAKTAEMNAFQKGMFIIMQSIAAAEAFINGITLGSKLAAMFPLAAPAMITLGTSLGAAQAGAIMGTTFAGTFDNGGTIPAGQSGIVAEYGDELVNGVMVKGPARVTSREETAAMMNNGGGSVSIMIENRIDGASYREERIDENTVKIIAEKVFNQNIDSGVSSVLGNRNSKSTKQLKNNFGVKGKY